MNIEVLIKNFPSEDTCKENLRRYKERNIINCKNCACQKHYWLKAKWQWQCSECKTRTTLRVGTIMENSKLQVRKWYQALAIIAFSDEKISIVELQRKLEHKRYEPIWNMSNQIQNHIENDGELYDLLGLLSIKGNKQQQRDELKQVG
jgi:hypothetical protein